MTVWVKKARSSATTKPSRPALRGATPSHRHEPVAHGHDPAAAAWQPSYLRPGTPSVAKFLIDLGYNTGEFGKNHLGDHTDALPTAHGFQEFWGYLYHLDAMQGV